MPETEAGRLAVLLYRIDELTKTVAELESQMKEIQEFRSKGMGAFWLASTVLGTGVVGVIFALVQWMRG